MHVKSVLIRFFKSFNFDYLRKNHPSAIADDWETINGAWFPFVRVPLCPDVTTIVGANESGKSHLLSAISKALTGEEIGRRDFCRYSEFFTVEEGKMRLPDFGIQFGGITDDERAKLCTLAKIDSDAVFDECTLIRECGNRLIVWVRVNAEQRFQSFALSATITDNSLFPKVYEIDSDVALPASVPISWLRGQTRRRWSRADRESAISAMDSHLTDFDSEEKVKAAAAKLTADFSIFSKKPSATESAKEVADATKEQKRFELARNLLFKVAKIDKAAIEDLANALAKEDEGLVNGILQQINDRLATSLNFPKWWVQDRNFQLVVSARDEDLVFTIRDKTRTEYSFGERSNGLKYFLSYYIQYLSHRSPEDRREILLMDEPDAYLSSQGQQDLLKIFNSFAYPEDDRKAIQVVYVTHSPFLIDRNHAERIRVLEKGTEDEGTRVVNDASKNHYEPLRSSFGAFVGETTFIGNCNVMVEGIGDQILLAGTSAFLRSRDVAPTAVLDLNRITIVPSGSASHVPYLVYLARGRDVEQPSVIVLLDSDDEGNKARRDLQRGGPHRKQLLKPEHVLQIADLTPNLVVPNGKAIKEAEDLVPPALAAIATKHYLETVCGVEANQLNSITPEALLKEWQEKRALFDAINVLVKTAFGEDAHIDKIGFARCVIEVIQACVSGGKYSAAECDLTTFETNVRQLHSRLAGMQRKAERENFQERLSRRVRRTVKAFLKDHLNGCRQDEAVVLLEDIDSSLDESEEADRLRFAIQGLRRKFDLVEQQKPNALANFAEFKHDLEALEYAPKIATQVEPLEASSGPQTPASPTQVNGAHSLTDEDPSPATEGNAATEKQT